jgi:[lysine-biosynthesis-protein LysW]--L-2-aminoadipate ligase
VNRYATAATCATSCSRHALTAAGAPSPGAARHPGIALAAIEEMGYPVVLKPVMGSWGVC